MEAGAIMLHSQGTYIEQNQSLSRIDANVFMIHSNIVLSQELYRSKHSRTRQNRIT